MTSPSNRRAINHLIRNNRHRDQNAEIILNTDGIEPKLDQIITAVGHTVIDTAGIANGVTHTFPTVDISNLNGIFEFQIAGSLTHASANFELEVSQNNIDFFKFPIHFLQFGTEVSATFDMVFRYHRLKVTNTSGSTASFDYIESGRH